MKLIENYGYESPGYSPLLIRTGWQVAVLNHDQRQEYKAIVRMDRHLCTDEVFCLLAGSAWLIAAEEGKTKLVFEVFELQEGIFSNIPAGIWHNIVLAAGAKVLIVERNNTHISDFEFKALEPEEKVSLGETLVSAGMSPDLLAN